MPCLVRCTDCCSHLCYKCDEAIHTVQVLHNRSTAIEGKFKILLPGEFIDATSAIIVKGKEIFFRILLPIVIVCFCFRCAIVLW